MLAIVGSSGALYCAKASTDQSLLIVQNSTHKNTKSMKITGSGCALEFAVTTCDVIDARTAFLFELTLFFLVASGLFVVAVLVCCVSRGVSCAEGGSATAGVQAVSSDAVLDLVFARLFLLGGAGGLS